MTVDEKAYPKRIFVERDEETNAKQWFTIQGMGVEYIRADAYEAAKPVPASGGVEALRGILAWLRANANAEKEPKAKAALIEAYNAALLLSRSALASSTPAEAEAVTMVAADAGRTAYIARYGTTPDSEPRWDDLHSEVKAIWRRVAMAALASSPATTEGVREACDRVWKAAITALPEKAWAALNDLSPSELTTIFDKLACAALSPDAKERS